MAKIGSVDLGDVSSEASIKSSNLFIQALPYSNSDEALIMDLFGMSRTITVTGVVTGTIAELRLFITSVEAIQTGSQTGSTFESSWTNVNKTVLIQDFQHTKSEADESKVDYVLTLVEGSVL